MGSVVSKMFRMHSPYKYCKMRKGFCVKQPRHARLRTKFYASRLKDYGRKDPTTQYFSRDNGGGWSGSCVNGWFRSRRLLKKAMKKAGCW